MSVENDLVGLGIPAETAAVIARPSEQQLKTHSGYTGSEWHSKTYVVTTTDATETLIASISIPSGYALSVFAYVLAGRSTDDASATILHIGSTFNNAGTVDTTNWPSASTSALTAGAAGIATRMQGNNTTDKMDVFVTGIAAETWYWVAKVDYMAINTSA